MSVGRLDLLASSSAVVTEGGGDKGVEPVRPRVDWEEKNPKRGTLRVSQDMISRAI